MSAPVRPRRVWIRRRGLVWVVELEFAVLRCVEGLEGPRELWHVERFDRVSSHLRLNVAKRRAEALRTAVAERRVIA